MVSILVVDDDIDVAETIQRSLSNKGYYVTVVYDGIEALKAVQRQKPNLIVLDVRMPHMSGMEVCRRLRQNPQTADIPIIFLTALTHLDNKLEGFEAGADDYITKPFETRELELRVRAVLRRSLSAAQSEPYVISVGELSLDRRTYEARTLTKAALLTPIEFDLLRFLILNAGKVFSSEQLLQEVWDYPIGMGDPALVRMHVKNLRDKIEDDPQRPRFLCTVSRRGYTIPIARNSA